MFERTETEQTQSQFTRKQVASRILLLLIFLAMGNLVNIAQVATAQAATDESAVTNDPTFLVHFAAESTWEERNTILSELAVEAVSWLPQIHVAEVRAITDPLIRHADGTEARSATIANALNRMNAVVDTTNVVIAVEENVTVTGADLPDDPALTSEERSYGLTITHAPEAWEYSKGDHNIVIAVVDTGINRNHPEFSGRIVGGYDFINNDDDPSDDNGHGTHTSGIIAAGVDNGIGSAGVCPQCQIMPVKVLNQNNAGTWSSVAKGILFATDNGARIINLSLGAAVSSQTLEDAVSYAQAHDVLIVAAAGNMGVDRDFFPAALNGVVAVSATDARDRHWSLSNYGSYIDVAAPGYAIFSTYHDLNNYYDGYSYMSGTSMAAPFVAGLAGLLLSQETNRKPADILKLITSTADKMSGSVDDLYFGHGRINVARALAVGSDTQWTEVIEGEQAGGTGSENMDGFTTQLFLPIVTR